MPFGLEAAPWRRGACTVSVPDGAGWRRDATGRARRIPQMTLNVAAYVNQRPRGVLSHEIKSAYGAYGRECLRDAPRLGLITRTGRPGDYKYYPKAHAGGPNA